MHERNIKLVLVWQYDALKRRLLSGRRGVSGPSRRHVNVSEEAGALRPVVLLHHLACTGGTLISKYLRDAAHCELLSEINPGYMFATGIFSPTNLLSQHSFASGRPWEGKTLAKKRFNDDLDLIIQSLPAGKKLVLRDWSHGDFCDTVTPHECSTSDWIDKLRFRLNSIVTVRHPIESFLSARSNNFLVNIGNSLDVYARRYLDFLDYYSEAPLFFYELFCANPESFLHRFSSLADVSISQVPRKLFSMPMSGDSGRSSAVPVLRVAKQLDNEILGEMASSRSYGQLCQRLGYRQVVPEGSIDYFL